MNFQMRFEQKQNSILTNEQKRLQLFSCLVSNNTDKTFPIQFRASTWVTNWEKNRIALCIEVLPLDPYLFMDITCRYYWSLTVWKDVIQNWTKEVNFIKKK